MILLDHLFGYYQECLKLPSPTHIIVLLQETIFEITNVALSYIKRNEIIDVAL